MGLRLGIFGGTFDPIHYGHLLLAECCREQRSLDAVWFLPAAVPPHKRQQALTPGDQRAEMIELAIGGQPSFTVCRYEIDRGGVNYTVDTLAELNARDPSRDLFFLMGADSLRELPSWKEPARLCALAQLVVVERSLGGGSADAEVADLTPLNEILSAEQVAAVRDHRVRMPRIDLSSSDLRARLAEGQGIRYRTPRAVEQYIASHGLYRGV